MDDCHGATATMVLSLLPEDQWHSGIGDNILADANSDGFVADATHHPNCTEYGSNIPKETIF